MDRRYGYHAFPRRDRTTNTSRIRLGLTILRSMVTSGLLLVARSEKPPGEIRQNGTVNDRTRISRTFAAFTVRTPQSLALEHSHGFGRFAIEFDVDALVEMGALPVFYLPLREDQESLGRIVVARLMDIADVLERLHNTSLTNEDLHEFFGYLTRGTRPLAEMLSAYQAVASLIESVEPSSRSALKFYEQ